jgi:hypothetical protein
MNIFELLFLILLVITIAALIVAGISALRGRHTAALGILRRLGIGAVLYFATALVVALVSPQRVLSAGDPWCFDDWCMTVEKISRMSAPPDALYRVEFRIYSRARRVAQRANGAWIYLIDADGRRYEPVPEASAVPLDVRLEPGESVDAVRIFRVPMGVTHLGVITGHGGPYCGPASVLIISEGGCLFRKPTMVRVP